MKVVQINSECGKGSTGKIAVAISKMLTEEGIENYIFYSGNHKSNYPLGIQINSKISIRLHQILSRFFGDQGYHSTITTYLMIRKLKRMQPDIIHLHNLHGYYLNIGLLFNYLRTSNARIVWTLHDCWAFTGHCTHFSLCGCEKWRTLCRECPQFHLYPYSWFFDRSRVLFSRKMHSIQALSNLEIVTPSQWLSDLVQQSFLKKYNIRVIHNGINLSVFKPTISFLRDKYGINKKYIVLGVASVWSDKKGLDVFIRLSNELEDKYQIVLVGTDNSIDRQLPDNIISIHRTSNQEELAGIYSTADVFVNPTKEEVFGLVNVEANACGTPVITYSTGGCPETISKTSGIVIKNDIGSLCKSIQEICEHKSIEKDLCIVNARKFDEKEKYQNYLSLYQELFVNLV